MAFRTDRLVEELKLAKGQVVRTPAIREPHKVRKEREDRMLNGGPDLMPAPGKPVRSERGSRAGAIEKTRNGQSIEAHDAGDGDVRVRARASFRVSPLVWRRAGEPTAEADATRYRAVAARCNFLGCDGPDVQYAAKEASRWMAKRCQDDHEHITRIGKYLNCGARRMELNIPLGMMTVRVAHAPTRTGRAIAMSLAEAELQAATRSLCDAMGLGLWWMPWPPLPCRHRQGPTH